MVGELRLRMGDAEGAAAWLNEAWAELEQAVGPEWSWCWCLTARRQTRCRQFNICDFDDFFDDRSREVCRAFRSLREAMDLVEDAHS